MFVLTATTALAQTTTGAAATTDAARPRIALVLSGGGARGFAHVGVLRALKDMRVPVDIVVGASMGAVVGGAYAAGRSVDDMERFVRETDWSEILADRPPRDDLAFRRREDDLLLPSRVEFSVDRSSMHLPLAAAGNAALESALIRLLPAGAAHQLVDRLPLPFRSVASDLLTGKMVLLDDTPLFMSIRASLAVPGVFAPVRLNNRLVVDGGLVRNLPVDIARAMGADIVIAVNVGTELAGESELSSAIDVARQMMLILTEQNVQRSLKELGPSDVLIAPELGGIGFLNFGHGERAMAAGEQAARRMAGHLAGFAVGPEKYAAFENARVRAAASVDVPRPLASVDVRPTAQAGRDALAARFGLQAGDRASLAQIQAAGSQLRNRLEFARVDVDIDDAAGGRAVTVTPVEADGGRSRLRLGLEVVSDFADDNRFTLSALHTLSWLNSWGAELRTLGRIGSQRLLLTQLWQPLAPGSDWYVAPSIQYNASAADVYEHGRRSLRLGYAVTTATIAVGRQFSTWGQVQIGVDRRVGRTQALIPSGAAGDSSFGETASYLQFQVDTLDSLALPSRGVLLQSRFEKSSAQADAAGHSTSSVIGLKAFRAADWVGHFYAEWARARLGLAPLALGGFLRLSGTERDSLGGPSIVLGRLVMARRIGEMPVGLGGAVRAGYSLELGSSYDHGQTSLRAADIKHAGSGFVSIDTRFGPLFVAVGATHGSGSTVYLFLGPFW